ncbi:MAG TPA: T9SS type A sorting domain-containing protein [Bacteroidota bacterium]|nr:T9SS type A sorting domain-containing protein [Bacteroidota bacterium]
MKRILTAAFFATIMVLVVLAPCQLFAANDTLVVYASGATLDKVIMGDTTAAGVKVHHVYKLVSRDTTYIFDATITTNANITVWGVPDPSTGKLPVIQPDVLQDNSIPGVLFTVNGNGLSASLQNLYLLGIAVNNVVNYGSGQAVQISGDNVRFAANNVVFEQWSQFAVGYAGNSDDFIMTNCKFRNMTTEPNQWYVGEVLRNENYIGAFKTDSIVIKNCTMLFVSGYATAATGGIVNYYEFSHNDVVYTFKNPFFLDRMVNAKFDNNIFYAAYAGGENKTEYAGWDSFDANTGPSIITMGLLDSTTAAILLGHASTGKGDPAAELLRKVEVKNNVYFWPSGLTSFYTAWNDTAHLDSVYTTQWMNTSTAAFFANSTLWPGFVQSGNQNVDPGFGASITGALNPGTDSANGAGLLGWFTAVRTGTGTTEVYGYDLTKVGTSATWAPAWPLPEANDLKYTNASLKTGATDGGIIGDPYWFNGLTGVAAAPKTLPHSFSLSEAYPNPFNPSTNIRYSLANAGNVTMRVYNVLGQVVKTLVNSAHQEAGEYTLHVDMSNLTSGVYFYSLEQGNNRLVQKMMLLK